MNTINTIEDLVRLMDENPQWVEAMRARLLTRELIELPEKFTQFVAEVQSFVEATNRRFDALEARFGTLEARVKSVQDDIGILKGGHARSSALGEAATIARDMGLRRTKSLTREELWALTDSADTSGISANELRSFRRADLIMEATGRNSETCYVAVEISFTANGRDTDRALRNARFLRRFTGKCSYAAVAGLYRDDRIKDCIESGEVFWYQLDPETLEAE